MFRKCVEKLTDMLSERDIIKSEDREIIVYGLTSGIELIFNIITTAVLGFIFGLLIESLIFLISFSMIRIYAGGYHCKKAIQCYLFSSGIIVLVLCLLKFTPQEYILGVSLAVLLINVPIILKLAPVETETKPLDETEKKYFRKKAVLHLCAECMAVALLFLLKLFSLGYTVCLGILVSGILVFLQKLNGDDK